MSSRDPRTAAADVSIWRDLPEETFRQHLVNLEERTNAVPVDSQVFDVFDWKQQKLSSSKHTLSIEVEQQAADDFARLVAVEEGAQSVAAVCLEEHSDPPRLTLRFAALDISLNDAVKSFLQKTSDILAAVASLKAGKDCNPFVEELFDRVVELHFLRLLARLRSSKWEKPKYLSKSHKKPLWQDFTNLQHRLGHLYARRETSSRQHAERLVIELAKIYQNFEETSVVEELPYLMSLINASYEFSNSDSVKEVTGRLEDSVNTTPTPQVASAIKCLKQIQKIGAYRRICKFLVGTAQNHTPLFANGLMFEYLKPYQSVSTTIGYESWAKTCHVHAEIQLIVHYDLTALKVGMDAALPPRCIGISKWLCYLCFRFIQFHGDFFPSKTHGRLYDQWTVPDLSSYDEHLASRYRRVLKEVDDLILTQAENEPQLWRVEPMTSIDLCIA